MGVIELPKEFLDVKYVGRRVPGCPNPSDLSLGANCQLFAYQLLRHFGVAVPDWRSSELWEDEAHTLEVKSFNALDLMLYHREASAWGAHVGVCLGGNRVVHLSKAVGRPVIWEHEAFATHERYAHFIGAKRGRKSGER